MVERRWVAISGSWRHSSPELRADVDRVVGFILTAGHGIVTGGALGVDFQATELALEYAPDGSQLKVILPTSLEVYAEHYHKAADDGKITTEQATALIGLLRQVDEVNALETLHETEVNERSYYLRNGAVIEACKELVAFQVNNSAGTQDAIDRAARLELPTQVFRYTVET